MNLRCTTGDAASKKTDVLILPFFESEKPKTGVKKTLDQTLKNHLTQLIQTRIFAGKLGQICVVPTLGLARAKQVLLLGLGKQGDLSLNTFRNAGGDLARALEKQKAKTGVLSLDETSLKKFPLPDIGQALAEGLFLGQYRFNTYLTNSKDSLSIDLQWMSPSKKTTTALSENLDVALALASATNTARDLANTPPNDMTPRIFVDSVRNVFADYPHLKLEVIDRKKAKELGMGAFLGVAQGSVEEPFMAILRYMPIKKQAPIALLGKGITFDTGGISIKPAAKMSEMKGDMSGAAAVFGAMKAIAELQPQVNVMGMMVLAENMPSGSAQRPGDIVKAMNGKTIEILNTDAEGRLVLADALCYAVQEGAKTLIDIATLTGAACVALGEMASGVLGNNQALINHLIKIGNANGDRLWQLPLFDEYLDYLKSEAADLANCSEGRYGGTCSAAKFLEQFVGKTPWAHLDIAPMMHFSKATGYTSKGMSGVGARTLATYVLDQA
ncbi:MAG: leucyl aminopeptidase [Candidatus Margulisiibacteriota bacterium]